MHRFTPIPYILCVTFVALAAASFPVRSAWAASLADARARVHAGRYDEALEVLADIDDDADAVAAALLRADVLLTTGQRREAERILRASGEGRRASSAGRAALGEFLVRRGAFTEAIEVLDPAVEGDGEPYPPARYWRALAFARIGRGSRSRLELEDFIREHNRGRARNASELLFVALACHQLELYTDANDTFRRALEIDPENIPVRVHWAELFLEKYRPDEALALLQEVEARNPRHPRALALQARAVLDLTYDLAAASELVDRALEVDAELPEALEVRVEIALDDRDYDGALAVLDRIAETYPDRLEALDLRGATHYLADQPERLAEVETRVLGLDADRAEFFYTLGEFAVRNFRYEEALELHQRALELDGGFWPAFVSLGVGYSRMGDDVRALSFLQRAFDADPFNEQAYNMVNLYEEALNRYRYIDDTEIPGLRYRFHRDESEVLERYVPDVIRAAYRVYTERYGLEPEPPVSIEVFADQATFGIRSVGLPHAGQHGICFGHVVTSRSPSEGDFNWRQVLEHELSHVFSLQASNYRVPRWFTEGLAEYDTMLSRPEWRREQDLAIVRALQRDRLLGVDDLNGAFVRFEYPEQVLDAYFQSALVVEFIGTEWGYEAIVGMLGGWRDGLRTTAVVSQALGVDVAELDERFEAAMRERYDGMLMLMDPPPYLLAADAALLEGEPPSDPSALAARALAEIQADAPGALETLRWLLELDPRNPLANLLSGHVAMREQRWHDARRHYELVLAVGGESFQVRRDLAAIARREARLDDAATHLLRAADLYPQSAEVHAELADLYGNAGNVTGTIEHLLQVTLLDQHDVEPALRLAGLLHSQGRDAEALVALERAVHVDPFNPAVHNLYGRLALAAGDRLVARRELELELLAGAADRQGTQRLLLEIYEALQLTEEALRIRRELME